MGCKDTTGAHRVRGLGCVMLLGLLCASFAAQAVVYKWVDAQGRIHYSDRPPEGDVKLISVENVYSTRARTNSAPAAEAKSPSATTANSNTPPPVLQKQVANDAPKANADGCKMAKERSDSVARSRRVYKEGPNGERIYMSNEELATARLDAQKDVNDNCAGQSQ